MRTILVLLRLIGYIFTIGLNIYKKNNLNKLFSSIFNAKLGDQIKGSERNDQKKYYLNNTFFCNFNQGGTPVKKRVD